MKAYFEFLRDARQRPEMYVGRGATLIETLNRIELVLLGFELREAYSNHLSESKWNSKFREFAQARTGLPAILVLGVVPVLVRERKVPPTAVWDEFFELVDAFESLWHPLS